MQISDITDVVKDASITVKTKANPEGEELKFSYRPNAYTPLIEQKTREATQSATLMGAILVENLSPVLSSIDLKNGKDFIDPKNPDHLRIVPLSILSAILNKIGEDMDPGKKKNDDSGGSFSE